ncbi:MAG: hypothetical protein ACLQBD_10890 [Syntrophobacteraceae bacterium]
MSNTDKFENMDAGQGRNMEAEGKKDIIFEDILRARLEGAFISPCGTEGARWEGFPEWPEEFPYDIYGAEKGDKQDET